MPVLDSSFRSNIRLGTILTFRYKSPGATDPIPTVLVISPNWQGKIHALNLRYLRPQEAEQLQWIFKTPEMQRIVMNPFVQEEYTSARKKAEEQAEQRKQEYIQNQQGVIVKPASGNPFGVSTFGPTRKEIVQMQYGMPGVKAPPDEKFQQEVATEQQRQREQHIRRLTEQINKNKALLSNPYNFYHRYIKPILGPNIYNVAKAYRKYFWNFIYNPRIVRNQTYGLMVNK